MGYPGYPYRRKMVTVAKNLGNWKWKIRTDLDVFQRCLTVAFIAHLAYAVMNALPSILMLWVGEPFFEMWLCISIAAAVARSAAVLTPDKKSELVTGCDTGFGLELAKHLHEQGFNVYAGCLLMDSEGAGDLASISESKGRMRVLQLDVTKEEDWECAREVKKLQSIVCALADPIQISTFQ